MGSSQSNRVEVLGYKDTYVEFEDHCFAEGTFRRVYRGTFYGDPRMERKQCVVKVNKDPYSLDLKEYASEGRRAYRKAHDMARLFNDEYNTSKPIEFVQPEFTKIDPRAAFNFLGFDLCRLSTKYIPEIVTVAVERFLEGKYEKFSNNFGYVNPKLMGTPAAFSHFTYDVTNGEVLVCNLQGVRTSTSYKLTDPAVHNSGPKPHLYGLSDLGQLGIIKFFMHHECNMLCKGLQKPTGARNCTTGEWVTSDKIAGNMPEGSVMGTYQLGPLEGLSAILNKPVGSSTMQPSQLGIDSSQIEQMQKDIKL